jgi:hypothetical protein
VRRAATGRGSSATPLWGPGSANAVGLSAVRAVAVLEGNTVRCRSCSKVWKTMPSRPGPGASRPSAGRPGPWPGSENDGVTAAAASATPAVNVAGKRM